MRRALSFICAFGMLASLARAQSTDAPPIKIGDAVVSSSLRTRMYAWNWFGDTSNGDYTYSGSLLRFGLTESKRTIDWQVEFAVPALVDMPTRAVRQLTFGEGTNESPAWASNGRHLAFMSTRSGKEQIFTIDRMGQHLKQITKTGNNQQPDWSR